MIHLGLILFIIFGVVFVYYMEKIIDMLDFIAWVCDGAPSTPEEIEAKRNRGQ